MDTTALTALNALRVVAYDPKIRAYLAANDPMALAQVDRAILAANASSSETAYLRRLRNE